MTTVKTRCVAVVFNLDTYYFVLFMTSCTLPLLTIFHTELLVFAITSLL